MSASEFYRALHQYEDAEITSFIKLQALDGIEIYPDQGTNAGDYESPMISRLNCVYLTG